MSQLGADQWVLTYKKGPGFFLDIGSFDGVVLSNTKRLESNGWKGIAVDPLAANYEHRPNTIVVREVLSNESGKEVHFAFAFDGALSGVVEDLGLHRPVVLGNPKTTIKTFKSKTVVEILEEHKCPAHIDYMNLDIEGGELKVLQTFPWDQYTVDLITVEHNYEEPKRTEIANLLKSKGYQLAKSVKWDDWYVREEMLKQQ